MDRNNAIERVNNPVKVALRKESVDRNVPAYVAMVPAEVALRKESVDRNFVGSRHRIVDISRSPQGERG